LKGAKIKSGMEWMIVKGKEGRGDGKGLVFIT